LIIDILGFALHMPNNNHTLLSQRISSMFDFCLFTLNDAHQSHAKILFFLKNHHGEQIIFCLEKIFFISFIQ